MDMNLLTALDALLEENSVLGAAQRLHLTPPAVSRTLARIRYVTGDDILVRSGRSMVPTPYALAIREEVRALVRQASSLLNPGRKLDLPKLDRVFAIRGHDVLLSALAPSLLSRIQAEAPRLQLRFLGEVAAGDRGSLRNEVDLELGADEASLPEVTHEIVGADRLMVACRRGHGLARGRLTSEGLANASHLNVSRRGRLEDRIDDAFAKLGLQRKVVASVPTCAAALEVVAHSDLVTIVPRTLCSTLCEAFGIATRELPLDVPSTPVVLSWHRRFESDPAHAWLRGCVAETLDAALARGAQPAKSRL